MAGHIPRTPLEYAGVPIHTDSGRLYILDRDDRRVYARFSMLKRLIGRGIGRPQPQSVEVRIQGSAFLRRIAT